VVEPGPRSGGLTAAELAQVVAALRADLTGCTVLDVARLIESDDLLLVCSPPGDALDPRKRFLHVAPGGARARVCTTGRRFGRERMASSPQLDALRKALVGATLADWHHPAGERRATVALRAADGTALSLHVELFGPRGLWALCDPTEKVLELSRVVDTGVRRIQPGSTYVPPPTGEPVRTDAVPRFPAPVLESVDHHFSALDLAVEESATASRVLRALERALARTAGQVEGLRTQLAGALDAARLRHEADLLLAWAHRIPRGADHVEVPDSEAEGGFLRIDLDPALPAVPQAQARYERARRLEDGRSVTEARLAGLETGYARLQGLRQALGERPTAEDLERLAPELAAAGITAAPAGRKAVAERKPQRREDTRFRRFTSAEGHPVFVGKDNHSNDELTCRFARGNDVWLHVGGGRAGSHVLVRLPKGKTASLETLLDAATLAIHFSKARGEDRVDVVYTFAKNVRKPRGSPAGSVVPTNPRTLTVRVEPTRLQRLLDGTGGTGPDRG
jgi:predicted ribosome quality control (RQC) complex YloA/Tae2 family protein